MTTTALPFVPGSTLTKMWTDLLAGATVKAVLVDTTYTPNTAHDFLNDVGSGARVATQPATVTVGSYTMAVGTDSRLLGSLTLTVDIAFGAVAPGTAIQGVWFYIDTGSAATSRLLVWLNYQADTRRFLFTPDGGPVTVLAGLLAAT